MSGTAEEHTPECMTTGRDLSVPQTSDRYLRSGPGDIGSGRTAGISGQAERGEIEGVPAQRLTQGQRQLEEHGGAVAWAVALGPDVSAVLAGNGADEEETETGALDLDAVRGIGAVEAFEDALQIFGGDAEAGVGDRDEGVDVLFDAEAAGDVDASG